MENHHLSTNHTDKSPPRLDLQVLLSERSLVVTEVFSQLYTAVRGQVSDNHHRCAAATS